MAPAQEMVMEMKNRLPGVRATIYDHPKTLFGDSLFVRQLRGNTKNLSHERSILRT
jgi:hypothetical protein